MPEKYPRQPTPETTDKATWLKIRNDVLRFILSMKMKISPEEAEDIAQTTMFKATKAIREGKLNTSSKLTTWFFSIAKNTAFDLLRRKKVRNLTTPISDSHYEVASKEPTVVENLIMAEGDRDLSLYLDELPPEQREIIKLYKQNLTLTQIAEQTKTNYNTVRSRLNSAQKHLRKLMNKEDEK